MNCLFCKIANKEIKSNIIFEDKENIAFYDANPQAPVHFLVIPKKHIKSAQEINKSNSFIIGHIFEIIAELSKELKLEEGFRIVTNIGKLGGQTIEHLHFHVLGKRQLNWPPG